MGEWGIPLAMALSAGATVYSSNRAGAAADKARRDQRAATAKATAEATAERKRIEGLDAERLERLRRKGANLPPSLMTGMSGVAGEASTLKPILG